MFDTYWIFESGDRLLLVDQHAAHERMLYDRLMERFEKGTVSQQLLSPQLVRLTAHDRALVSEFAPVLADAGFEVEPFDDTCVAVKAIPTLFGENESPRELLLEALDEWQAGRGQVTRERMRRRVAQMACQARPSRAATASMKRRCAAFCRRFCKVIACPPAHMAAPS